MEQKTEKLYPSAPLEYKKIDLEQRLEKNLNDVNSFNCSINNIKEMITRFKDRNHKSKKKFNKYKTLTTILKSFDTIVIIATTPSSITSVIGTGLIAVPISAATACGLSFGSKVIYEIVMQKYNKSRKQSEKDQQTIKSFDKKFTR